MSVTVQTPIKRHTGNGVTTVFAYDFLALANADLQVKVGGALKTLTTDYTVSGAGNPAGGSVTFTTAPANGAAVLLKRAMPYERQAIDYQENGELLAETHDDDHDAPVLMIQQLAAQVVQSIRSPDSDAASRTMELPADVDRADKLLGFDSDGNAQAVTPVEGTAAALSLLLASTAEDSNGDALIGALDTSVSGAEPTTHHVMLNLKVKGLKRTFGATGDGTANDTAKINNAFGSTGKIIEIEDGTYSFTSNLNAPLCSEIRGYGELYSILKPSAAVTLAMALGHASGYPTVLQGFQLDGSNTTNAIGMFFGNAASMAALVESMRVSGFAGASGVNIRVGDMLKSKFLKVTSSGGGIGLLCDKVSSGFPTTVDFDSCVMTGNTLQGAKLIDGHVIRFCNTDFESNGAEGLLLLPDSAGAIRHCVVDSGWFEDNWASAGGVSIVNGGTGYTANDTLTVSGGTSTVAMVIRVDTVSGGVITAATVTTGGTYSAFPAQPFSVTGGTGSGATFKLNFHMRIGDGTALGGAVARAIVAHTRFGGNTNEARAILADGSAAYASVKTLDRTSTPFPAIIASNDGVIDFPEWNSNDDFELTVTDTSNRCTWIEGAWRSWTPTYASSAGDSGTSFTATLTTTHARFRRQGKTVFVNMLFNGTCLGGVNPTYLTATLPTNITVTRSSVMAGSLLIGATYQACIITADAATDKIVIQKIDASAFGAGAAFTARLALAFEAD